jgi:hypothetical protein
MHRGIDLEMKVIFRLRYSFLTDNEERNSAVEIIGDATADSLMRQDCRDGHYFFFEKRIAVPPPGIAAIDQGTFEFTAHPGMLEPLDTISQTHS